MPKPNTTFICQNCAYESRKWLGKCPECGEWNSLVEERVITTKKGAGRNSFRLREARAVAYSEIESQDDVRNSSGHARPARRRSGNRQEHPVASSGRQTER